MRGVFDEKEPEERGLRRETEFTLSGLPYWPSQAS